MSRKRQKQSEARMNLKWTCEVGVTATKPRILIGVQNFRRIKSLKNLLFQFIFSALGVSTLFSSSAHAENYLVILKNPKVSMQAAEMRLLGPGALFNLHKSKMGPGKKSIRNVALKNLKALGSINSLVVQIDSPKDLAELNNLEEVALVEREVFHPSPRPVGAFEWPRSERKGQYLRSLKFEDPSQVGVEDSAEQVTRPWGIDAVRAPGAWSLIGFGAGIRVGVLDTGIDPEHPSLKNNFEEGADFVTGESPEKSFIDLDGHGSHVAGTIAGVANGAGFSGVAPEARLFMGRVCGRRN